jgi:hypothetical protein
VHTEKRKKWNTGFVGGPSGPRLPPLSFEYRSEAAAIVKGGAPMGDILRIAAKFNYPIVDLPATDGTIAALMLWAAGRMAPK